MEHFLDFLDLNQLSEIIRSARRELNKTQDEIAIAIGIERKTYSTYESGRSEPNIETLGKITRVLNIGPKIYFLLTEQNVPHGTNLTLRLPGPEAGLGQLVKVQLELRHAEEQIGNRIRAIVSGGKDNSGGDNGGSHSGKDNKSNKRKYGKR